MDQTDKSWLMTQLYDMHHRPSNREFHLVIPCLCPMSYYSHCTPTPTPPLPLPPHLHPPPLPPPPPHTHTHHHHHHHHHHPTTPPALSINGTMHEKVQVSATRWFCWNWRIRLNSQSDNDLWNWAEWRVYASLNQVVISSRSAPGYFRTNVGLFQLDS